MAVYSLLLNHFIMKIAGGLVLILVLGALESLEALGTPLGRVDGGEGVSLEKDKGLTLTQTDTKQTETHQRSETGGDSNITRDGNEYDSKYEQSHTEDKEDTTKNTRQVNVGGGEVLNYKKTEEASGSSQTIDKNSSKTHQKEEEIIQEGNKKKHKKYNSETNNLSQNSNSREISREFTSKEDAQNGDAVGAEEVDNNNNDPRKSRRKRHTVYDSQNEPYGHTHIHTDTQETHYNNYGSDQEHLINSNEQHAFSNSAFQFSKHHANDQRSANVHEYSANNNYGSNIYNNNYRSGSTNQNVFKYRNSNKNYGHRTGDQYLTTSGKGNYILSNGRSNGLGSTFAKYDSSLNENLGSSGRNYRLRNRNLGSLPLRNGNSRFRNVGRNNNIYIRRNNGIGHYRFANGFAGNNVLVRTAQSNVAKPQNGDRQVNLGRYRQGVKHEDVLRFLSNHGRRFSKYPYFNTGNHLSNYESYNTGYRPSSNGYSRAHIAYHKYVPKHSMSNVLRGTRGTIDLHHFVDNTHYSTGNGRYVFIPGKSGDNHRYYDRITGHHLNVRKITLHSGKNVIVPRNFAGYPLNGSPRIDYDYSGPGLDLGAGISYLGEGKYCHQGQIIPAATIAVYLKTLGITSIPLTSDGIPLGLTSGYFPLDLGSGITYQGDGTYKYEDTIIPSSEIIEFCKSEHIDNISFTDDGFPEDLLNGNLDSIFKNHLILPIHLEKGLDFIGNAHYKWKDQIIPSVKITQFIKEHDLNIKITKEGLPVILFKGTLETNNGSKIDDNLNANEDEHLNPHGIFPYDVGSNVLYDGRGSYIYHNLTIPRSNIIEFCKSHDLNNISFTNDGFPASLFNDTENSEIVQNWKYPIYIDEDLYYIGGGHYKYKNQIILASEIGKIIKKDKLNVHITKDGLPLALYVGALDHVFEEEDELGSYENGPLYNHERYPLNLGSNMLYIGNGSYSYHNEIISSNDIIEFCKSHSITNISFTDDGYPASLFNSTEDSVAGSDSKLAIDLGDNLFYYENGHYRHNNKTITVADIVKYVKDNKLNVSVTDDGLPSKLMEEHLDSGSVPYDNELIDIHKNGSVEIYGHFPYDLGFNISYLGDGSYRCNNEIIYSSDIINYCKSHDIKDIEFTEDGFPASLFNEIISDKGSNKEFPVDLGKGLYFLGYGHYEYENNIYPASNITDVITKLNLNISLNTDGIPNELFNNDGLSSSNDTIIDLGYGLLYENDKYIYHNKTISADDIVEFCKGLNLTISFTEDGYPQVYYDEKSQVLHESSECPKGPIDLGEEILYIGDCNYMYQDHVIPSKYILGLLDILHIHDIQLPVGPDDNFTSKGDSNDAESKDDLPLDLGFDVFDLGNGTHEYKNRFIPAACYADFLKILGLKTQPGNPSKLVEESSKSDKSEDDILDLIDKLLNNQNIGNEADTNNTTNTRSESNNAGSTSKDNNGKSDSSNENGDQEKQQRNTEATGKPYKDDNNDSSSTSDSGDSTTSSTSDSSSDNSSNTENNDSSTSSSASDTSSSDDNNSSSNNKKKKSDSTSSSTTSSDDTSDSSDSSSNSHNATRTSNTSSTNSSNTENSDSSGTNTSDDTSESSDSSSSSNNTTRTSNTSSSNSSNTENSDSSGTNISDDTSDSTDSSSKSNNTTRTSNNSSTVSSNTENSDSSGTNTSDDTSESSDSSSSSNNTTRTSNTSSSNSSNTENSDSSGTNTSDDTSDSTDSSSNSNNTTKTSNTSSTNSSNTENSDSSGTNTSDDTSESSDSSSSSNNTTRTSNTSSSNSSNTENSDSSGTNTSDDTSDSTDSSSNSNNTTRTSNTSSTNSSNTENSDSSGRNTSEDTSESSDSSSSSNNTTRTSNTSSTDSSNTENSDSSGRNTSDDTSESSDSSSSSNNTTRTSNTSSSNSSNTENSDSSGTNTSDDRSTSDNSSSSSNNSTTNSDTTSDKSPHTENKDSSAPDSPGSGDSNATKDSHEETVRNSKQREIAESHSRASKEKKEKDNEGNTKIKESSSSAQKNSKEQSTKEDYHKTDGEGNKETYHQQEFSKKSSQNSSSTSYEKTTSK